MLFPDRPVHPLPQRSLARVRRALHRFPDSGPQSTRGVGRHLWRAALFAGAGLLVGASASGYRFFRAYYDGSNVVESRNAVRWDAAYWPAGGVLE